MKWQETYVSEGLNRKTTPADPRGIYRGLNLAFDATQGGGDRRVAVDPDPDSGAHEIVYRTTDGFSLTYRDESVGQILFDLSDGSLDNTGVVVGLLMDYQIGVATSAQFIAYTVAEYDALPAGVRDELVVMGTIDMPGPGINIAAADIWIDRRTMPWEHIAPGMVKWTPVIRNGSFERSETLASHRGAIPHWLLDSEADGHWHATEADSNTGLKSLELWADAAGTISTPAIQTIDVPVRGGQWLKLEFFRKFRQVLTGGTLNILLSFRDKDGVQGAPMLLPVDHSGGIDTSWVREERYVLIPTGSVALGGMWIIPTSIAHPALSEVVRIDDIQIWLQSQGPMDPDVHDDRDFPTLGASRIDLRGIAADWSQVGGSLDYNPTLSSGGTLTFQRLDQDSAAIAPAFMLLGRMANLGSSLLQSLADATTRPKLQGPVRTDASIDRTLIQQWGGNGGTDPQTRMYVNAEAFVDITVNAKWDGSSWAKDNTAKRSTRMRHADDSIGYYTRPIGAGTWIDSAWDRTVLMLTETGQVRGDHFAIPTDAAETFINIGSLGNFVGHSEVMFGCGSTGSSTSGTHRYLYPGYYPATAKALGTEIKMRFGGAEQFWVKQMTVRVHTAASVTCTINLVKNPGGGLAEVVGPSLVLPSGAFFEEDITMNTQMTAGGNPWDLACRVIATGANPIPSPYYFVVRAVYTLF